MKKFIALSLALLLTFTSFVTAAAFEWAEFDKIWHMQRVISNSVLYDDVDGEYLMAIALMEILNNHPELYEMAARAMLATIDEYSVFRNEQETQDWISGFEGEFGGIGIMVLQASQGLLVVDVLPGGSALYAGVLPDDIIIYAGGVSLQGITQGEAISHIRGPVGSEVEIVVRRAGVYVPLTFTLTRGIVTEIPATYEILEDYGVLYLQVHTFNSRTDEYVESAFAAAYEAGITNVLLDLRNNAGGLMSSAISLAERFVYGDQVIVTQQFRDEYVDYSASLDYSRYNVVVLVNSRSASASEVVAAAILENEVGVLVGERTFGKATVQTFSQMFWGDSITYTVAEYLTPNGNFIHGRGILPNIYVENVEERFDIVEFGSFEFDTTYRLGSYGYAVSRARKGFDALGISIEDFYSRYFDDGFRSSVVNFQRAAGLYPSGEFCPSTQIMLIIRLQNAVIVRDLQFEEGIRQLTMFN